MSSHKQQEDKTWWIFSLDNPGEFLWSLIEKQPHLQDFSMSGTQRHPLPLGEVTITLNSSASLCLSKA